MIREETVKLIQKYGGAVPRYTSYPTAVELHAGFMEADAISQLENLDEKEAVSVYVHIPFCHSLCHYCGCHTKIVSHTEVISTYVDMLCNEIRIAASHVTAKIKISRIHFGGGSPNYAPVSDIEKILNTLRACFFVDDRMRVDMECDPRLLTEEKITALSRIGIGRVSLGVQDFDENVQKAVHRIQPLEHVQDQVKFLRRVGINDINFDLIVGLPVQTFDSVRKTVMETIKIRPSRIAVFAYAHVPWMKKHQKLLEQYRFPTPQERFMMQEDVNTALCQAGYIPIGIDHYALPESSLLQAQSLGTMRRNFQGYTDDVATTILGFGLSAISQFKNAYTQNSLDAPSYRKAIDAGRLPVAKGYVMTPIDIETGWAIMQLMCYSQLDISKCPGVPIAHEKLEELERDGIIRTNGSIIVITQMGKPFTRVVASCFDPYFQAENYKKEGRHAQAI
ncbi:MAG: oxygen-independent coproporphyrinogen III oxidase [Alphaproteobacteria bacterium]|mgnify:CR=1 FL=1|nr:oxygen-independent coproporphyrinogen III oxidase [Alphaproteobacteria bacterium]OJV45571.1 MAG: oxygen-independent coproporphyrinogen III oxidase [Alphaproteobacteria bacterium 43-37]